MPYHLLVLHCQQAMEEVGGEWHFHVHYPNDTFQKIVEYIRRKPCDCMEVIQGFSQSTATFNTKVAAQRVTFLHSLHM